MIRRDLKKNNRNLITSVTILYGNFGLQVQQLEILNTVTTALCRH